MKQFLLAINILTSVTFGMIGSFSPAHADIVFEREANNTDRVAQVLPIMGATNSTFTEHMIKGAVSSSDTDFYRVFVDKGHLLALTVTAPSGIVVTADLYYDHNDNVRADLSELVQSLSSQRSFITLGGMSSGTYFLKVRTLSSTVSSYDVTWRTTTAAPRQVEVEPNNQSFRGTVVQGCFVGLRQLQGATNSNFDGVDFYRFTVCSIRTVTVNLGNFGNGGHINLYHNKNGNGRIDSGEFLENKSGGSIIRTTRTLEPGEYFLEVVKPFGSGSANYLLSLKEGTF